MERLRLRAQNAATEAGINFLDDRAVTIGGVQFLGTTLWTDFDVFGQGDEAKRHHAMSESERWMNDFRLIRAKENSSEIWSAAAARLQHQVSLTWLEHELSAQADLPQVVVTHHAPHPRSIAPRFADDVVTAAFVSDLTTTINRHQPALWLHGHTHTSFDYRVGRTRMICNPRGYGRENAAGFDPGMIIEIG
jgi:Icc-related predicted phosphoesterase